MQAVIKGRTALSQGPPGRGQVGTVPRRVRFDHPTTWNSKVLVTVLIGLAVSLVAAWVILALVLVVARPKGQGAGGVVTFFPNVVRLLRDLHADHSVPRSVRTRVWIAILYNIQPFTLIPDFIPVIGFADNLVVTAWALRSAVRKAGGPAVASHWRGTPDQLAMLFRIARLGPPPQLQDRTTAGG